MPRVLNDLAKDRLNNVAWLEDMHCVQLLSIGEISQQLKCTPASVAKAIKAHNICPPTQQQLREASLKRKYGVTNVSQLEQVSTKVSASLKHRSEELKLQRQATSIKRHGVANAGSLFAGKNKRRGRNNHITTEQWELLEDPQWLKYQHHDLEKSILSISKMIGVWDTTVASKLDQYEIEKKRFFTSEGEREISDYIKSVYHGEIKLRDNSLGFEIDIFMPAKKIAIEYCGLYYYSEQMGKNKLYHHTKWLKCKEAGIQLLTIFEDEWYFCKEVVQRTLLSKLGLITDSIYARNTTLIDNLSTTSFVECNHIQGSSKAKYHFSLLHDSVMVAAMQVQKTPHGLLISRYCTDRGVVGGFGKLFKGLRNKFPQENIYTFADHRWSTGNLYEKFLPDGAYFLPPDYCYAGPGCSGKRVHKFNFRHKHLPTRLKTYDPELTETKNCDNNGLWRIWDCGKTKYTWFGLI